LSELTVGLGLVRDIGDMFYFLFIFNYQICCKVIKTKVPQSSILQKYIECFYVFNKTTPERFKYLAFPHYHTSIAFFKGAVLHRHDFEVSVEGGHDTGVHLELLGKYMNPVLVQYEGRLQEVSIVFKPMGLNRFIREQYFSIAPNFSQPYVNSHWELFGTNMFQAADPLVALEDFLLAELEENQAFLAIERSLPLLEITELNYTVTEIAELLGYTPKTFQRHFTKYMGCTPVDYRRIVRFRNAMASKLNSTELKSLTALSYEHHYFDQSYFIKEFKRLTSHNPKIFFKEVSLVDGEKIVWEIL
jgi:AraC-like DNA-binding protein